MEESTNIDHNGELSVGVRQDLADLRFACVMTSYFADGMTPTSMPDDSERGRTTLRYVVAVKRLSDGIPVHLLGGMHGADPVVVDSIAEAIGIVESALPVSAPELAELELAVGTLDGLDREDRVWGIRSGAADEFLVNRLAIWLKGSPPASAEVETRTEPATAFLNACSQLGAGLAVFLR